MSNLDLNCLHTAKIATYFKGVQVHNDLVLNYVTLEGAQWLSCRVLASRPRGRGFEPHWRHCIVALIKISNCENLVVLYFSEKVQKNAAFAMLFFIFSDQTIA